MNSNICLPSDPQTSIKFSTRILIIEKRSTLKLCIAFICPVFLVSLCQEKIFKLSLTWPWHISRFLASVSFILSYPPSLPPFFLPSFFSSSLLSSLPFFFPVLLLISNFIFFHLWDTSIYVSDVSLWFDSSNTFWQEHHKIDAAFFFHYILPGGAWF